ncbi:MAG: hypothetical protein FJ095_20300 [Deltaproteobacteria bacterium]|nr:hypothetical protein [Deltaproteobacteria bacterium]
MRSKSPRRPTRATVDRALKRLALEFAARVVEELAALGLFESDDAATLAAEPSPRRRRTVLALEEVSAKIVELVASRGGPLAIGTMATALGIDRRELAHPLALLVTQGKLVRTGARRGARYAEAKRGPTRRRREATSITSGRRKPPRS